MCYSRRAVSWGMRRQVIHEYRGGDPGGPVAPCRGRPDHVNERRGSMTDTDPKDESNEEHMEDGDLEDIAGGAQEPCAPAPGELRPERTIL